MQRMGRIIGIEPAGIEEYKRLHAAVLPAVLECLKRSNISNYSVFLQEPENLLFSYWEYTGTDFEKDLTKIAHDPAMKEWWTLCSPLQRPLESRGPGEWWSRMEEVFYLA
ncbi:MAG: L-rhamnose mutarotase [Paracoccaceae bacterium]